MKKYSILIVDDIKENIDILTGILEDKYDLRAATRGELAIKIAGKLQPNLVLLDIMMPEMDGYEVCRRLKENPETSSIPVIFVSAKDEDIDEAKGFEVGAVDYISKPVNPLIVKSRVETHLSMANRREELEALVVERTAELEESRKEILSVLSRAGEFKDNETGFHVNRVGQFCYYTALALGLEEQEAIMIKEASPLHDIGKIGIPDNVLLKPGKLNEEEWVAMRKHCEIGREIMGSQNSELLKMARTIILEHHEKVSGLGYPFGLMGDEISIHAKIVAICDVFDALTSKRPYKEAWPIERALALLEEEKGKHFDVEVVDAFISVKDKILKVIESHNELD